MSPKIRVTIGDTAGWSVTNTIQGRGYVYEFVVNTSIEITYGYKIALFQSLEDREEKNIESVKIKIRSCLSWIFIHDKSKGGYSKMGLSGLNVRVCLPEFSNSLKPVR